MARWMPLLEGSVRALCALALLYWLLQLTAPAPILTPAPVTQGLAETAPVTVQWAAFGQTNASALPEVQLLGVVQVLGRSADSRAVIMVQGQKKILGVNDEIQPGVAIVAIRQNEIDLSQGGSVQTIKLPRKEPAATTSSAPPVAKTEAEIAAEKFIQEETKMMGKGIQP